MNLLTETGDPRINAARYALVFPKDRPFVYLEMPDGERLAELFVFSSVPPMQGRDETYRSGAWTFEETPDGIEARISAESTAWTAKTYTFRCAEDRFSYGVEVTGQGDLAEALYFGGYYSESLRWSSGFFWSGQKFAQLFNPEPNIPEVFHLNPASGTSIDLTGVPIPAKGDWFFTPPPFCFAGQFAGGWLALGVEAQAGTNTYTEYQYHGSLSAFHLSLSYEGHTRVDGAYQLPSIGFDFADDEYAALAAHVAALRKQDYVPLPERGTVPDWWRTPIFCGWGAQCYLASQGKQPAPTYARQAHYVGFMQALEQNGLDPGIVVLDDKWQATYGSNEADTDKWPDLRGFIDQQHRQNRHVLLWLKAWDPEGLPVEECVTHAGGLRVAVDLTNPAYEARLRASVRKMLSDDGYDADGFKIDFTARIPSGPGLRSHQSDIWGLELMRRYLSVIASEARQTKPDALIIAHTPHPYLADVVDMIRLNDINIGQDVNRAMTHRARIAALACPEALIDTDNWPITDKATWRAYMAIQAGLGVPALYYATHIDFTGEPLDDADYALIRQVWAQSQ